MHRLQLFDRLEFNDDALRREQIDSEGIGEFQTLLDDGNGFLSFAPDSPALQLVRQKCFVH